MTRILISLTGYAHVDGGCNHYPNKQYDYQAAGWGWISHPEPGEWDLISEHTPMSATQGNPDIQAYRRCPDCVRTVNRRREAGDDTFVPAPGTQYVSPPTSAGHDVLSRLDAAEAAAAAARQNIVGIRALEESGITGEPLALLRKNALMFLELAGDALAAGEKDAEETSR